MHSRSSRQTVARCWALLIAAAAGIGLEGARAQDGDLRPRWVPEKPAEVRITQGQDPGRLVVKLRDDAETRSAEGLLVVADAAPELAAVRRWFDAAQGIRVSRLFPLADAELDEMRARGERNTGAELADLSQYYSLELEPWVDAVAALRTLLRLEAVEIAYAAPRPAPPPGDIPPTTPLYESSQGYLAPAPAGVDGLNAFYSDFLPSVPLAVVDIEYSWNLKGIYGDTVTHEDLDWLDLQLPVPAVGNTAAWVDPFNDTNHGTAALSILAAGWDAYGVTGLLPGSEMRVAAANTTNGWSVAAAILLSLRELQPGDVILIEQQWFGPNWIPNHPTDPQFGMLPVEYLPAEFKAILQATALCVHVVEAAGNGSQDLDSAIGGSPGTSTGDPSYPLLFNLSSRDSGAVLVGSAAASVPHTRIPSSNHGSRVDAYSWGGSVVAAGYGDLFDGDSCGLPTPCPDVDQFYTQWFGGTSAASAILAGCAGRLQGRQEHIQNEVYRPDALRLLLRTSGTPPAPGERIGNQPDLKDQEQLTLMGQNPAHVLTGPPGEALGSAVAGAGDVDGDGFDDLLVGAPLPGFAGGAYVFSGRTGTLIRNVSGGTPGALFGGAVAASGDVDGDGFADYAVGAHLDATAGAQAGMVLVVSGATGAILRQYFGTPGEEFGFALADAGDVDADGFTDLVVGAPGANGNWGRTYVYSGGTGALMRTMGGGPGERFGFSVAGAGDMNGDGFAEVVGGAPEAGGGAATGRANVYDGLTNSLLYQWDGQQAGGRFGLSVAGGVDVDGDGSDDVVIGEPFHDGAFADAGRVHVYSGWNGTLLQTHAGQSAGDRFGLWVAGVGDFDQNGFGDFWVGAPYEDVQSFVGPPLVDAGAAYLFDGLNGAPPARVYYGRRAGEGLGTVLAGAGDLNADGRPDLVAGVPLNSFSGPNGGRAYSFLAPPAKPWRPRQLVR